MRPVQITPAVLFLAAASLAPNASAAIVGFTGQTNWLIVPPLSCVPTALTGNIAYAWNERQNVFLNLAVDMVNNPGSSNAPVAGGINGVYDSHFLHFDDSTGQPPVQGTVTFNNPIVAVIFTPLNLDNSDIPAGAPTTIYPTGYPFRGLPTAPSSFVTILGNTLTFDLNTFHPVLVVDQVRIITQVPTPGSTALLGLAGVACIRRRRR